MVLIIGILASVAVPQYRRAVARAKLSGAVVMLKAVTDATKRYHTENDTWPTANDFETLDIQIPGEVDINSTDGSMRIGETRIRINYTNHLKGNHVQLTNTDVMLSYEYSTDKYTCRYMNNNATAIYLCQLFCGNSSFTAVGTASKYCFADSLG